MMVHTMLLTKAFTTKLCKNKILGVQVDKQKHSYKLSYKSQTDREQCYVTNLHILQAKCLLHAKFKAKYTKTC